MEETQKGTLDITERLGWFLGCLDRSFDEAERTLAAVFRKARFRGSHGGASFNERQSLMLNKLLDGIEGKLTSSKWAKMAKCSRYWAARHRRPRGPRHPVEGPGRGPKHKLLSGPAGISRQECQSPRKGAYSSGAEATAVF